MRIQLSLDGGETGGRTFFSFLGHFDVDVRRTSQTSAKELRLTLLISPAQNYKKVTYFAIK